ncbi:WD40 domain containing protein [Pyrrhoderma noxium]|uniref:WD40 domain containing protein n=1 Tax=Pyrrhoderma noxium TaxID=2282107 RepID=A0A286UIA8_9AGAM|nr:WD40 domain containing protein [Pyrrhoderma noxium]
MEDTSSESDNSSTEEDPEVPEKPQYPHLQLRLKYPPPPNPATQNGFAQRPRNAPHYRLRHTLRGHQDSISAVKFSPDGTMLASTSNDKLVKIWSPNTGEFIHDLIGHTKGNSDISWSSDSVYLASASDDRTIKIWDVDSGITSRILKGHGDSVFSKAKCLKTISGHFDYVTAVHFNRDASLIVSCALDGLIKNWNTKTGVCLKTLTESKESAICQHVQFSPNSKCILSTAHDSTIRLWDYQSTRCLKSYVGHVNQMFAICVCFSVTGGKWIVSGSEDKKVYLWDLQSREIVQVLEGHEDIVVAVATHSQQNMIASASFNPDLSIRIWIDSGPPQPVGGP